MARSSLSTVATIALVTGVAALANCSSHPADRSTGGSASSSSSSSGAGGGPSQFQADPPAVYVAKVKNVLIGQAPTDQEIQQVTADPTQLKALIDQWMTDPAYEEKMRVFFELAFQQTQLSLSSFLNLSLPQGIGYQGTAVWLLVQNIQESFARTVIELAKQGKPLTDAMTTKSFMMTPPLMEFYGMIDEMEVTDQGKFTDKLPVDYPTLTSIEVGTKNLASVTLADSVNPSDPHFMQFYNPDVATVSYGASSPCTGVDPIVYPVGSNVIQWLLLGDVDNHPGPGGVGLCGTNRFTSMIFSQADFGESAWKMVTIRPPKPGEQTTRFFDLPALRTATELVINTPRVGFFSTPAFFANWGTNVSNQMRVTLNQALLVALGAGVDGTDATNPPSVPGGPPGLDPAHAAPGTTCYGCHQLLDPGRAIFSATWTYPYYTQLDPKQTAEKGQFVFWGVTNTSISSIDDFASTLAAHPLVPGAWAQKLCYYVNSQACDTKDPELQRIVSVFKSSGLSWTSLVRELLSSPITTNATPTLTTNEAEVVAVSRRDHLCAALDNRLGLVDVCGLQPTTPPSVITQIVAGLPADGYGRGSAVPVLPSQPTLFFRAGMENICGAVAQIVIDNKAPPMGAKTWTSSMTPDSAIADFTSILMAIEPSDPRSMPLQAALMDHFTSAVAAGVSTTAALESTFTVACLAPSTIGIGM